MDWIVEGIAIGSRREAMDARLLEYHGIDSALLLYDSEAPREEFPLPGEVLQLVVQDARPVPAELLRQGAAFVRRRLGEERKVLVACALGISRSPSFVVAYLVEEGMDLREALRTVVAGRRVALPHPELLQSIVECYGLAASPPEVLRAVLQARIAARAADAHPEHLTT
jgi:hypothetical protein